MTAVVLDASVVFKWFRPQQRHGAEAKVVREDYAAGRLSISVPSLLSLELLNAAARRWSWDASAVQQLAVDLTRFAFSVSEPSIDRVATWTAHGLTAYDAAYVALADGLGARLISDDERVLEVAAAIALPLSAYRGRTGTTT
ncbi:MAG: type II toxin-antitoxin system VapC family toxin [Chloroflexi bacterium]|nr:type II toxin-antitoxin system VapC family toxin [Chloroflexota bacterium]